MISKQIEETSDADMVGVCINLTKNSKYDIKTDWRN